MFTYGAGCVQSAIRVSVNKVTRGRGFITPRRTRQGRDPGLLGIDWWHKV